jgi:hypothetical protein
VTHILEPPSCCPWRREAQEAGEGRTSLSRSWRCRERRGSRRRRADADAVYPEDRSASAAMDALNVDHHLFGRMPER